MTYELVLQRPALSIDDYDAMLEIEEALIQHLTAGSEVDGHDVGSGEVNIFIHTNEPARTFEEVSSVLRSHNIWPSLRAGYRNLEQKNTVIWPKWLSVFEVS